MENSAWCALKFHKQNSRCSPGMPMQNPHSTFVLCRTVQRSGGEVCRRNEVWEKLRHHTLCMLRRLLLGSRRLIEEHVKL